MSDYQHDSPETIAAWKSWNGADYYEPDAVEESFMGYWKYHCQMREWIFDWWEECTEIPDGIRWAIDEEWVVKRLLNEQFYVVEMSEGYFLFDRNC